RSASRGRYLREALPYVTTRAGVFGSSGSFSSFRMALFPGRSPVERRMALSHDRPVMDTRSPSGQPGIGAVEGESKRNGESLLTGCENSSLRKGDVRDLAEKIGVLDGTSSRGHSGVFSFLLINL